MKTVLSIQSHVAYGHVGNAAAVFPLQRMGIEVMPVHTVQFSNHTGYGNWTGQVFDADHIRDVLKGIEDRGALTKVDALLTGYMGAAAIAEVILELKSKLPQYAHWVCDPVMGDTDRGFFVHQDIPMIFRDQVTKHADIMTPNQFELEYLSGHVVKTLDDAKAACKVLHDKGVKVVLVTSLIHEETATDTIEMIVSERGGSVHQVATAMLPLSPAPNGAGDATAALFTGHLLHGHAPAEALIRTASGIFAIFEATQKSGGRELALVQAQDKFI
jgi:pyridoxine kinase